MGIYNIYLGVFFLVYDGTFILGGVVWGLGFLHICVLDSDSDQSYIYYVYSI